MDAILENGWNVVSLPERLTGKEALNFSALVTKGMKDGQLRWMADAARLRVIDSFAIGILVRILRDLRALAGELCIRDLAGSALEIFKRSGLNDLFLVKSGLVTYAPKGALSTEETEDFRAETMGEIGVFVFLGAMDTQKKIRNFKSKALLIMADRKRILLDMEKLKGFTGAFAEEVLTISRLLRFSDGEIRICRPNQTASRLLKSYSIDGIIQVFLDREIALEDWK